MSSNGTDKEQSAYRFTAHLGVAVWTCRSANPSAGVSNRWRASQVAPLRFPGDGVQSIVGATFMSPGWQVGICRTAAVCSANCLRACQSICGRANPSAGVTSGAPTSPGRRFINRRGDIHVARVAGGNMRDRGGLVPPIHLRACQSVGGRAKPLTGVTSGAPTFPGRRFVSPSCRRASQVAFLRFPGGGLSIVGATFMSPRWQAGICGNDGLKQVPEADRNTSSSNNPIKTKNHADSKIIKRCGNAGFRLWRVSGDSRGV